MPVYGGKHPAYYARPEAAVKRRRMLVALGVALALLVTPSIVLWTLSLRVWARRGHFWEQYQRVQPGMTEQEVEAILGPPMDEDYPGGSLGPHDCAWDEREQKICVVFDTIGHDPTSRVIAKRFLPETVWETLQRNGTNLRRWSGEWP